MLIISTGATPTHDAPNQQYFIGSFDGKTFTNDNPDSTVLWVDQGPDTYAGIVYNELPDKRRIFVSWMNRWDYAQDLDFNVWNGQMTIPRVFNLVVNTDGRVLLASTPIRELNKLRTPLLHWTSREPIKANYTNTINNLTAIPSNLLDIELTIDVSRLGPGDKVGLQFGGVKDKLLVYFNGSFVVDRTNAGRHDFSPLYRLVHVGPRFASSPRLTMKLILDVSSLELFADNGLSSMTTLFFSEESLSSKIDLFFESKNKTSELKDFHLAIYQLKSVWK